MTRPATCTSVPPEDAKTTMPPASMNADSLEVSCASSSAPTSPWINSSGASIQTSIGSSSVTTCHAEACSVWRWMAETRSPGRRDGGASASATSTLAASGTRPRCSSSRPKHICRRLAAPSTPFTASKVARRSLSRTACAAVRNQSCSASVRRPVAIAVRSSAYSQYMGNRADRPPPGGGSDA